MKNILIITCIIALSYWYVSGFFTDNKVESFLLQHEMNVMEGKDDACDDFSDDITVEIVQEQPNGRWEVSGGKNEICGFAKQTAAQLTVLQASYNSRITDLDVESDGLFAANVTYTEISNINVRGMPNMQSISHDKVRLERGLMGSMKIASIESNAEMKINR